MYGERWIARLLGLYMKTGGRVGQGKGWKMGGGFLDGECSLPLVCAFRGFEVGEDFRVSGVSRVYF